MAGETSAVAETILYVEAGIGERKQFRIRISAPIASRDGDASCRVVLGDTESQIFGVDGLQALTLAIRYARAQIIALVESGRRFYFQDSDDEPIDPVSIYFA